MEIFEGVWKEKKKLLTKNLVPGKRVYKEKLIKIKNIEYREWIPNRSKPAAGIMKGLKNFPLKKGIKILYLGLASSTTASHFSDIISKEGILYGVEISKRSLRDSLSVAEARGNIVCINKNARKPQDYPWVEKVDFVFQDIASNDQPEILIRNCKTFLKPGGYAMLSLKSRSMNVVKEPKDVYKEVGEKLKKEFKIIEKVELDPYEKDHMLFVLKWK
ncbi:MAG: fibrillarin-like rRNA/tRNA 2'-O-methyltransferase [Candidatus Aenigmarchaeota archaeon]|nr:fibrillarin-like rRNA/tRNA 2'-O-methyltransferase [Candidatus Aenigmarchaeota archaeon]